MTTNPIFHSVSLILTKAAFIFLFLVIFFFAYASRVEKEQTKDQFEFIVDTFINDLSLNALHKIPKKELVEYINDITEKAKSKVKSNAIVENKNIDKINSSLKTKAFTFGFIFLALVIILFFFLPFKYIREHLTITIIITFFIALTEYIFLTFIASQYTTANPNNTKKIFGKAIVDWIKKNKNI